MPRCLALMGWDGVFFNPSLSFLGVHISNESRVAREPSSPNKGGTWIGNRLLWDDVITVSKCLDMSYTPYKPWIVDEKYTYLQHNHPIVGWLGFQVVANGVNYFWRKAHLAMGLAAPALAHANGVGPKSYFLWLGWWSLWAQWCWYLMSSQKILDCFVFLRGK